jgi:hypothetical protein
MTQSSFDFAAVAREIHHFLWVSPFFNSHCKLRDEGLMCRDHALVITALLKRLGVTADIAIGRMAMISGPSQTKQPRAMTFVPHAWTMTDHGVVDFSVKVSAVHSEWREWHIDYVLYDEVVGIPGTSIRTCGTERAYENLIALATYAQSQNQIIYYYEETVRPDVKDYYPNSRFLASKISELVKRWFPRDRHLYYLLIEHLARVGTRSAESMAGFPQKAAWAELRARYAEGALADTEIRSR